jgi:putative transcription antitermination factor YqgF
MKVLGLDVGEKRIGVAQADSATRIAVPVGYIIADGTEWEEIRQFSTRFNTKLFVVGLPRSNDGNETAQSQYVRNFVARLAKELTGVQVKFQDESLTSVVAEERLRSRRRAYEKGEIDAEAASIILQDFLEAAASNSNSAFRGRGSSRLSSQGSSLRPRSDCGCPSEEVAQATFSVIESIVRSFVGKIKQIPPKYSAIKVNGQRAYKLARKGAEFEMPSREVEIYAIEILHYEWPELTIRCHVSSGTYIRTLAEDIGVRLGTGAYLTALRRTRVGKYDIKNAVGLDELLG